jgi:hypothetical protein
MGTSNHYRYSGGHRADRHDLLGCKFLLPLGLIGVETSKDVVDLLVSLREVALWVLCLLVFLTLFADLRTSSAKPCNLLQSQVLCFLWGGIYKYLPRIPHTQVGWG